MRSLRTQLFATYVVALVLVTALVSAGLAVLFNAGALDLGRRGLDDQSTRLQRCLGVVSDGQVAFNPECEYFRIYAAAPLDLKYRLVAADGRVLLSSDPQGQALAAQGMSFSAETRSFVTTLAGLPMRAITTPLQFNGALMYLQVARSDRLGMFRLPSLGFPLARAATFMLGSLLVFAVAVFYTLRRMLRPLREASEAAARIEPHVLSARLPAEGLPSELVPLVSAFNLALDRFQRGYRVQQELLASVAHELKTPLALIRGQIELSTIPERIELLGDVDFMARQVHQLLHLAEVSGPQNYVFKPTDLVEVVYEGVDFLTRLAEREGVTLRVRCAVPDLVRDADRSAAFIMLKNLIENAIQHSPRGGQVTVGIEASSVVVCDQGRGIATEDFENLFRRFWRGVKLDGRPEGAGLGLAICSEIANAHDWGLDAANGEIGACFEIRLD
jgi:signal transduction histidine kinase